MDISKYVYENNIIVVEIIGDVDASAAQVLGQFLNELLVQGHKHIVLDVSSMSIIASAGIRSLLYTYKDATTLGAEIRIFGPNNQVERIFMITGLNELMQIADKIDDSIIGWE